MISDPIGDMLTRIRNAQAVGKKTVELPFSGEKKSIAEVLEKQGFIGKVGVFKQEKVSHKMLSLELLYEESHPKISEVKRVSKPGKRVYQKADEIRKIKGGIGMSVISTSRGVMSNKEAKAKSLGGEVICEIW